MKTLNKPQIILPLIVAAIAMPAFFSDHIFPFPYTYVRNDHLQYFTFLKAFSLLATGVIIIFLAITLYHRYTINLHTQYLSFFDGSPIPMAIACSHTNRFVAANKAAINVYGYSQKEFLQLSIGDIRVKEELEELDDSKTINDDLKIPGIWQHRKKCGETISVEVSSSDILFKKKKCRLLLAVNVTEVVKAREEKRIAEDEKIKQQNFISYVVENFPVDVAIFDKNHRYILLNKTAVKDDAMRKWMIGKDDFDYFRKKGTGTSIAEKRRERFLNAIAGKSEEWIDEHIVDGKPKYMLRKFYPYYENGELKYVYGYGMDITEVRNAQVQRDEYIAQLEKIAFTTSHEIRQPICNLQGLISLIEMEKIESQQVQEVIACMQYSINAMDEFTRDLGMKLHEYKQSLSKKQKESVLEK